VLSLSNFSGLEYVCIIGATSREEPLTPYKVLDTTISVDMQSRPTQNHQDQKVAHDREGDEFLSMLSHHVGFLETQFHNQLSSNRDG